MTRAIGESRLVLPSVNAFVESSILAAICARFCDFGLIHRGLGLHDARTYRRPRGRDRAFLKYRGNYCNTENSWNAADPRRHAVAVASAPPQDMVNPGKKRKRPGLAVQRQTP